jgi:predicted ATPase
MQRLPVIGRNAELGALRKAYASARSGGGRLIEITGEPGLGKSRLLDALREAAAGFRNLHASCEAYTASTPYALWSELLRELMSCGRDDSEAAIIERLSAAVATRARELTPWLPLIGIALRVHVVPTPEVEMLAEANRRSKLHECVRRFLRIMLPETALIEIENAHHMDGASAEFLSYLTERIDTRPWLFAVTRRPSDGGFVPPQAPTVVRIELKPLVPADALRLAQLATQRELVPARVLEVVATRSGGNPQFLRDLLRSAIESGDIAELPASAEAVATAQIDNLTPEDRAIIRRAAVFGNRFHPKMLAWFADVGEAPLSDPAVWDRLRDLFFEEPRGHLRFRRPLLRDAAYKGLPETLRRELHRVVAARLEKEMDSPEAAGVLSLHYFEAGEYRPAFRYASVAARHADGVYAYAEAAGLYSRAVEAGRRLEDVGREELAAVQQALGDSWYSAGEFRTASDAYTAARPLVASDLLADSRLLIKLSHLEEKLGKHAEALRWIEEARAILKGLPGVEAAQQAARARSWCAALLRAEGRTSEAIECAEQTVVEAEAAGDAEALAEAYFVMAGAYGELGKPGAQSLMQRSLEAYQRAGNVERQTDVLSNIGVLCQWEGHWDEALSYYKRARDAAEKIGGTFSAAVSNVNIAEILTDRGEWTEAEELLVGTLPVWKASHNRYYLGHCLVQLGRVLLRTGRFDEALNRFEEAKTNFLHVGSEQDIPPVEAWICECQVAMGDPDAALALARRLLADSSQSRGLARVMARLKRLQAHALLRQGDSWGARESLEESLTLAKERHNPFEAAITMLSLIELDRLEGVEPALAMVTESHSLLSKLKIRAVPSIPLPEH